MTLGGCRRTIADNCCRKSSKSSVGRQLAAKSSQAEVEPPRRVEQVIAGVRTIAADNGLSPDMAEATYRAMISAFIAIETEYSGKLNAEISQSPRKSNHAGERIESPPATARAA